ncbi:MAG: DUF2341 domain-containing protein [Candidatus Calescibacterium sp.]
MSALTGWQYRRLITINNSGNSNSLIDYQVVVTLDTQSLISAGKMKGDGGDIRFTDSDGTTLLNYWVESGMNTSSTYIWVKVPSIPANSTKTIYLYYGNPSAISLSNDIATFDYCDRGDQLSFWTVQPFSGQSEADGNPIPSYYSRPGSYMFRDINLTPPAVITFNIKTNAWGAFFFLVDSSGAGQMYRISTSSHGYSGLGTTSSWTTVTNPSSGFYANANVWYKLTIVITDDTSATLYYSQTTDASPRSETWGTQLGTYTITNNGGYIGLRGGGTFPPSHITLLDNIIVRKYTFPEPTINIGPEEFLVIRTQRRLLISNY